MNVPVYIDNVCWFGVIRKRDGKRYGTPPTQICGVPGSPLYKVGKPSVGLGTCMMYLCNDHADWMRGKGYTLEKCEDFACNPVSGKGQ